MKRSRARNGVHLAVVALLAALAGYRIWTQAAGGLAGARRLFPVLLDGKVGYMDSSGRLVVAAEFDPLRGPEYDAITAASPPIYYEWRIGWAGDFAAGRCAVRVGKRRRAIDAAGRFVASDPPERMVDLSDAILWQLTSPPRTARPFGWQQDMAKIDRKGLTGPQFTEPGRFVGGLAPAPSPRGGGLWGYVDAGGRFVIPPRYTKAYPFDGTGLLDALASRAARGEADATPPACWPAPSGRRLAVVQVAGGWGIIDDRGRYRTPPILQGDIVGAWGLRFSEGRARVVSQGQMGFVDTEGRLVIPPRFYRAEPFSGGLARVMVFEKERPSVIKRVLGRLGILKNVPNATVIPKWGYVDREGKWVWHPTR